MRRIHTTVATLAVSALLASVASPALAAPGGQAANANNNTSQKLRAAASADGGFEHLQSLQAIADANDGTRASGTPGYDASADYVVERLRAAGYTPTVQDFMFPFFENLADPTLTIGGTTFATSIFTFSGSAPTGASGTVQAVDVNLTQPGPSTSGCEDADFTGFIAGRVALIQRGTCTFEEKVLNAQEAGAVGVVLFNQGNTPARSGLLANVTLNGPVRIPVVGLSFADGATVARATPAPTAVITTSTVSENRATVNVIAQTSGRTDNVVMVGAHLDSVAEGPGINDNGSGTAGILEIAEAFAKTKPTNAVRFAWWGAEELGLLGSEYYVANLAETEGALEDIALYLNFDMIASPNFARMVYDGDDSDGQGAGAGPAGSEQIEELFTGFFSTQGLNSKATDFSGRSDYGPFIAEGIPSGGLFTGAEEIATELDNRLFGSTVDVAFDPNYHEAGDTIDNLDLTVFEQNIDAIAHSVITYGYSTESVNGVKGSSGKGLTTVTGPGGGIAAGEGSAGGGGLREGHADHVGDRE